MLHAGGFSPSPLAHGDKAGVEERREGSGSRGRREGVGGAWRTESVIKNHIDKALSGGEAEGSLTSHSSDSDELNHGGMFTYMAAFEHD